MAIESHSADDAQGAKEQVQEKAHQAADEARSRLQQQVDQRSTQVGEQVSSSAHALRSTAERLRDEGQDGPAKAAEQLAGHAEKVGSYLSESDADRILHDVEEFARRQPLAVVGIGLFAGFAASRFLKASSRSRYESSAPPPPPPRAYQPRPTPTPQVPRQPVYDPPAVPSGVR
ncbi:hypothetical protein Q5424_18925 [Conexibacter sp. JD483]|uniref:hypothetical protein n=1 Tax=unclassified Conexibacter TaxID=2627773 RepID=UPI00271E4A33|nr:MULTISPECIES: hypothetical protein [unclassified Conexibacter]MDO8188517.1 hypothetical protein [Conexibacter sp. CPCC 205706]MDO8200139.1 hypothetical protein [Conexibacter sp. CPCC 205762]MDR9371178.1 hypothetical protein [Conexibacter sp. JD483]